MWNILEFDEVLSTSTLAKERWIAGEAKHGDVFQARHQTGGRGRIAGRQWHDQSGASLLMTILLEHLPDTVLRHATLDSLQSFQMMAAHATIAAVRELASTSIEPERLAIKEPNDILLDGLKLCGILTEAVWQGDALRALFIGIGLNVHQWGFEGTLAETAISLEQARISTTVNNVRDEILRAIERTLLSPFSVT
ncbi:MAG: biotin--[acetyl-CoA-carboxylase] ligase [Bacteroidota bacterium]|nr:biotin--[acetyl-CoA-carboxylase] ligase [Bacteroidota bacterium]MDP4233719.1 biotin--[acetyl-CoA-carboxylase] ligase [Bacteroidota bacterium]MDP4242358.1 biotin--[acetyl-CoA-carboxylase] ligase [Bacteroidota bacterium]MDP4288689.1 biotin--[acetyl-CoA-carboxylase] ligase [Bacteroidota bacterium]